MIRYVFFSLLLAACGGSKNSNDGGTKSELGTSADLAVAVAQDFAGACNTLSLTNVTPITINVSNDTAPTLTGGTIGDGTYVISSATVYGNIDAGADPSATVAWIIQVSGNTVQVNTSQGGSATASFTTSGSSLIVADSCPDTNMMSFSYTATSTTLTIAESEGSDMVEFTFTKS